jgi:hypothetical protein
LAVAVDRRARETLIALGRPVFVALGSLFWFVNKVLFGWLEVWTQRKADSSLLYDVRTHFFFLFAPAETVKERWHRVLLFDYASVRLNYKNICFCFSRGREELNISLSPRHAPRDAHKLTYVVAALDSVNTSKVTTNGLDGAADLIRPRLRALNEAFSECGYAEFAKRL